MALLLEAQLAFSLAELLLRRHDTGTLTPKGICVSLNSYLACAEVRLRWCAAAVVRSDMGTS